MKYKFVDDEKRVVHIMCDEGNSSKSMLVVGRDNIVDSDYQAYLKWLEEGNTPEPADEG